MSKNPLVSALLGLTVVGLVAQATVGQSDTNTKTKTTNKNGTTTTKTNTNPYKTNGFNTPATNHSNRGNQHNSNAGTPNRGTFVPGKTYAVTSSQKTLHFGGKDVVLPQGVQFQFQDGFLIISLPPEADRNVAVVRLGKTYLVVTKKEKLAIDPTGIPQTRNRIIRRIRPIRKGKIIRAIDDAPDASPIRP